MRAWIGPFLIEAIQAFPSWVLSILHEDRLVTSKHSTCSHDLMRKCKAAKMQSLMLYVSIEFYNIVIIACQWKCVWLLPEQGFSLVRSGLVWFSLVWIWLDWFGLDVFSLVWFSFAWLGLDFIGLVWLGLVWFGFNWIDLVWFSFDWFGLAWIHLDLIELVWFGLVCIYLDWFGFGISKGGALQTLGCWADLWVLSNSPAMLPLLFPVFFFTS